MSDLFRPDIAPNQSGGLALYQNGQKIVIGDGEVEEFIREMQEIRRRQLINGCLRIAREAA